MDVIPLPNVRPKPPRETAAERAMNIVFTLGLVATVIGLWIYFR